MPTPSPQPTATRASALNPKTWGLVPRLGLACVLISPFALDACGGGGTKTVTEPATPTPTVTVVAPAAPSTGASTGAAPTTPTTATPPSTDPPAFVAFTDPNSGAAAPTATRQSNDVTFTATVMNGATDAATGAKFQVVGANGKAVRVLTDSSISCGTGSDAAAGSPDPNGLDCAQVASNDTATLAFSAPKGTAPGTYHIVVTANGGQVQAVDQSEMTLG